MKPAKPLSFVFFFIIFGIHAVSLPFMFLPSGKLGMLSGIVFLLFLLSFLLVPVSIVLGIIYKTEIPDYKLKNRIGLWGTVVLVLAWITVFVVYKLTHHGGGFAAPG